jgi:hypothetical protein
VVSVGYTAMVMALFFGALGAQFMSCIEDGAAQASLAPYDADRLSRASYRSRDQVRAARLAYLGENTGVVVIV